MTLEQVIKPTQKALFKLIRGTYRGTYFSKGKFILVRGKAPVMLVAHLDTVHEEPVRHICQTKDGNIIMSPQGIGGDDRCGVFALMKVYDLTGGLPWLLFTCDEERGGLGADAFCLAYRRGHLPPELDDLKFIVEIDRRGANDAVYYDCDNPYFEAYVTDKGFTPAHGSFSDISYIAPELNVAAVNLSSGYYNAHQLSEYINRAELEHTIDRVAEMVQDAALDVTPHYEYVRAAEDWDWDYTLDFENWK